MKKRKQAYNNPEYKQIKDHLPEILEEMEKDKDLKEFQIPEEWDNDFERIYQKQRRKERIRTRILTGACCAVILGIGIVHIGEHMEGFTIVQADDIGKIHEDELQQGKYQYSFYINSDVADGEILEDTDDIFLKSSTLKELNSEIKEIVKTPSFTINANLDKNYIIKDATYNKMHRNLNYRIEWDDKYIYISQQMQIEDTGSGTVDENMKKGTIYIDGLKKSVDVYYSAQDNSLNCSILYDKSVLFIVSNLSSEKFDNIIKSIQYE